MSYSKNKIIGIVAVFTASILWGTTGTVATFSPELGPFAIGAIAMGIGGISQGLYALKSINNQYKLILKNYAYVLIGCISVFLYPLAFYSSMHLSGVAIGTTVSIGAAPFLSALLEKVFNKSKLSRAWLIGTLIGLVGIALLSFSNHMISSRHNETTIGIVLGLIAAFTYSIYSWSAKKLMNKGVNPRASMGVIFGIGGVLLLPIIIITFISFSLSLNNVVIGLYMALVPMFIGYLCYGYGLSKINVSMATTITLFELVVATLLAVIIVGERLSILNWFGIILIFICLIIATVQLKPNRTN